MVQGTNVITNQVSSKLEIPDVSIADVGEYHVEITDGLCRTTSATATLRMLPELQVELYAVVTVHGVVGHSYRVEYSEMPEDTAQLEALGHSHTRFRGSDVHRSHLCPYHQALVPRRSRCKPLNAESYATDAKCSLRMCAHNRLCRGAVRIH